MFMLSSLDSEARHLAPDHTRIRTEPPFWQPHVGQIAQQTSIEARQLCLGDHLEFSHRIANHAERMCKTQPIWIEGAL